MRVVVTWACPRMRSITLDAHERTIPPALGDYGVGYLEQHHPKLLDRLYAALRRCRRSCGGRRGLIDHRPAGRGKRLADGTPNHECDERCRPHECRPAEAAALAGRL